MKNYYPEKPVLPYQRTMAAMTEVIAYLQAVNAPVEHKRAAYIMFRNESANGTKGINNNYAGVQADSGRWPAMYDDKIIGTVIKTENKTGKIRVFCAFEDFRTSIDFLLERVAARGLYVGGVTHKITRMNISDPVDLAIAYKREWVTGNGAYKPSEEEINAFLSMYRQAAKLFV